MRIGFIICLCFLVGCNVRFPQLEAILSNFEEQKDPLQDLKWTLVLDDYRSQVLSITIPEGIAFANKENDAVLFDGHKISRILKIGATPIQFDSEAFGEHSFKQVWPSRPPFFWQCTPWVQESIVLKTKDCKVTQQGSAESREYRQLIRYDGTSNMIGIEFVIDASGTKLILTKNNSY